MHVVVVGSGPSGVAVASVLLEAGHRVDMLDVGVEPEPASLALAAQIREQVEQSRSVSRELLRKLKRGVDDSDGGGIWSGLRTLLAGSLKADRVMKRILGSQFAFSGIEAGIPLDNVALPRSLARGGLSNVWGASCYPLREEDYQAWPISTDVLVPYYVRAAELLSLIQHDDGLAQAYPIYGARAASIARNPGSSAERLIARWQERRSSLARYGLAAGRTRLAVRQEGAEDDACRRCGLCFYGCAFGAIYTARRSLERLGDHEGFRYRPGLLVLDFCEQDHTVRLRARRQDAADIERLSYDALFLAAGTLSSLRIAADSLGRYDQPTPLLDNDMYLVPMLLTGNRVPSHFRSAFTMGEAVVALDPGVVASHGVHLQFYSFHEFFLAELGEVLTALPEVAQRAAWAVLNNLLLCFVYLSGQDSVVATASVRRSGEDEGIGRIHVDLKPCPESRRILKRVLRHLWKARQVLGFVPLTLFAKATPLGFSGHLAGSLPMRYKPNALQTDGEGRLAGTRQVFIVDAAAIPALPAQNLTYTVMANAMRVADIFSAKAG